MPKFDGLSKNSIQFIQSFEKYFLRKSISENLQLIIVEDALIGKAKMWHDARTFPFINYQHFKMKFLEEFYSIEARMLAKYEWENRRFKETDRSLQSYYMEQLSRPKFCLSSFKEYEINYLSLKQLPQRTKEVLATIDYNDTSRIMQALARLDVAREDSGMGMSSNGRDTRNYVNNQNYIKSYKTLNHNEPIANKKNRVGVK